MNEDDPPLQELPASHEATVKTLVDMVRGEKSHRRVCAMDRRGWLLSRMDARSRKIIGGLELMYPTSRLVSGLWRAKGWGGWRPMSTPNILQDTLRGLEGGEPVRVFHFGERPGLGQRVLDDLAKTHPCVEPVGVRSVLDELWGPENNQALFQITDAKPDILLVALPSPLVQEWVHAHAQLVPAKVVWGVGRGVFHKS